MDDCLNLLNYYVVNPYITHQPSPPSIIPSPYGPWSSDYSLTRQFLLMWVFLYSGAIFIYFVAATITYALFYTTDEQGKNRAAFVAKDTQMKDEVWVSVWSLAIMSGMTGVMEMIILMGHSYLYDDINTYGLLYLIISPVLFLVFTDFLIYWIHRALHHPLLYHLHKLHHKFKETTPYSAFHFHPLDGFAQSFPYHIFIFFFPMQKYLYLLVLFGVGLWTVNIHDRVTFSWFGVNGAAHHTIHHTKFNYNYGQYFTWCDTLFGTYLDPHLFWPYNDVEKTTYDSITSTNNNNSNEEQLRIEKAAQVKLKQLDEDRHKLD